MLAAIFGAVGVVLGGVIGIVATIVVTHMNNKSAERRHMRELFINLGLQEWKESLELAKIQGGDVAPVDTFVLHGFALGQQLIERGEGLTPETALDILKKAASVGLTTSEAAWSTELERRSDRKW